MRKETSAVAVLVVVLGLAGLWRVRLPVAAAGNDFHFLRCAARAWDDPAHRPDLIGFRVVSRPQSRSDL